MNGFLYSFSSPRSLIPTSFYLSYTVFCSRNNIHRYNTYNAVHWGHWTILVFSTIGLLIARSISTRGPRSFGEGENVMYLISNHPTFKLRPFNTKLLVRTGQPGYPPIFPSPLHLLQAVPLFFHYCVANNPSVVTLYPLASFMSAMLIFVSPLCHSVLFSHVERKSCRVFPPIPVLLCVLSAANIDFKYALVS